MLLQFKREKLYQILFQKTRLYLMNCMSHCGWNKILLPGIQDIASQETPDCESNCKWKNPNVADIADIKTEDITVCKTVGEWDVSNK